MKKNRKKKIRGTGRRIANHKAKKAAKKEAREAKKVADAALFAKFPVPPLSPEAASAMQSKSALEALKYAQDGAEAKFWRLRVQSVFGQDPIEYYNELKARCDDAVPAFQRAVEMADVEQAGLWTCSWPAARRWDPSPYTPPPQPAVTITTCPRSLFVSLAAPAPGSNGRARP